MQGLVLSLQFFTRVPLPIQVDFSEKNVKKCFYFLPWIGLLYGLVPFLLFTFLPNQKLASCLAITVCIILGESLHLDGLADCADAFFSARNREKMFLILKDPHIGTFGVIALILTILLKVTLFQQIAALPQAFFLPTVLSRIFVLYAISFGKPAKQEGLGYFFSKACSKATFFVYLTLIVFFLTWLVAFKILSFYILVLPLLNFLALVLILKVCTKKLGGTTGDVNGLIVEVLELINLLALYFIL